MNYSEYQNNKYTKGDALYRSLGSFWTQVFQERLTIKGYSFGLAQELIQSYYELVETVNRYSVHTCPVFEKTRWHPIIIKSSEFNKVPFVFEEDGAVFGAQPESDIFFADVIFKFGLPKSPTDEVFVYNLTDNTKEIFVLSNRILSPSYLLFEGADIFVDETRLFFNKNPFLSDLVPKVPIIDENGVQTDEYIILWGLNTNLDASYLHQSYGYIFDFQIQNDQFYKDVLIAIMNLYSGGPEVGSLLSILGALLGVTPVIESEETVVDIFNDVNHQLVITDKNVYKFNLTFDLRSEVAIGKTFESGYLFVDLFDFYDSIIQKWWNKLGKIPVGFNRYVFIGNYEGQLFFKNDFLPLSMDFDGVLRFPVQASLNDVEEFNSILNANDAGDYLDILPGQVKLINPVDFIFTNIIGQNVVALVLNFNSQVDVNRFIYLFPFFQEHIPKHLYLVAFLSFDVDNETYDNLSIPESGTTNSDGSDVDGIIVGPNYADISETQFAIGLSPLNPFDSEVIPQESDFTVDDGTPLVTPPVDATTQNYPTLNLLSF